MDLIFSRRASVARPLWLELASSHVGLGKHDKHI